MSVEVDLLREAVDRIRTVAESTTAGRWDWRRTSTLYMDGRGVYNLLAGGMPGIKGTLTVLQTDAEHMVAWDPTVALAVAALLERTADGYETKWDTPECPSCADECLPTHERAEYHVVCEDWVPECQCLAPFVVVARAFLRREAGEPS